MQLQQFNIRAAYVSILAKDDDGKVTLMGSDGEVVQTTAFAKRFGGSFKLFLITFHEFLVIDANHSMCVVNYYAAEDNIKVVHMLPFKINERVHKVSLYNNILLFVTENSWYVADVRSIIHQREKFWHERVYLYRDCVFVVTHNSYIIARLLGQTELARLLGQTEQAEILGKYLHSVTVYNLSGADVHNIHNIDIGPDTVIVNNHFVCLNSASVGQTATAVAVAKATSYLLRVISTQDGQEVAGLTLPDWSLVSGNFTVLDRLNDYIVFVPKQTTNNNEDKTSWLVKPVIMALIM